LDIKDEPLVGNEHEITPDEVSRNPSLAAVIRNLVNIERYAVLCTQMHSQPYGSLVAFAFSDDLKHVVFATPIFTRKYRLLSECDRVAMVIDSRDRHQDDLMKVEGVTATGRARQLQQNEAEFKKWAGLLIGRHTYMKSFVEAPSTAVFVVDIVRYFHVRRFQEVSQWIPTTDM
jgi:uncharacterized protein YhbP (UPF0306 family)